MSLLDMASWCEGWWDEMASWTVDSVRISSLAESGMGCVSVCLISNRKCGNRILEAELDFMPWDDVTRRALDMKRMQSGHTLCELAAPEGCLPEWKEVPV